MNWTQLLLLLYHRVSHFLTCDSQLKDIKKKDGKKGRIPEHVLANATYQILYGLGYLHYEKRLHRDLKPGNILMNSLGKHIII